MTHKQAVLRLLSDHKPHTHHELYALGCVAHSRVSDLRADGYRIEQWRDGDHYLYQLVTLDEPEAPHGVGSGSSSVPAIPSPPPESSSGTLLLFDCDIDESAGLRGAYSDEAA